MSLAKSVGNECSPPSTPQKVPEKPLYKANNGDSAHDVSFHCNICFTTKHRELELNCGHSLCTDCARKLKKTKNEQCPFCRMPTEMDPKVLSAKWQRYREDYSFWRRRGMRGAKGEVSDICTPKAIADVKMKRSVDVVFQKTCSDLQRIPRHIVRLRHCGTWAHQKVRKACERYIRCCSARMQGGFRADTNKQWQREPIFKRRQAGHRLFAAA